MSLSLSLQFPLSRLIVLKIGIKRLKLLRVLRMRMRVSQRVRVRQRVLIMNYWKSCRIKLKIRKRSLNLFLKIYKSNSRNNKRRVERESMSQRFQLLNLKLNLISSKSRLKTWKMMLGELHQILILKEAKLLLFNPNLIQMQLVELKIQNEKYRDFRELILKFINNQFKNHMTILIKLNKNYLKNKTIFQK